MSGQETQQRIILWSVPRSLSTAFYRAIMNGPNTKGFIEPYGEPYYWGKESTSDRYEKVDPECTFKGVRTMLEGPHTDCQTVFVKDMAFFPVQIFKDNVKDVLPNGYTHTFLIRNPKYSIPSFYKMSTDEKKTGWKYFDPKEVGFKESLQLFHEVKNLTGTTPAVVDANDLLENPEAVLRAYCESTNLDFCSSMINWEDNPYNTLHLPGWPEGWFTHLLSSKTFKKPVPKDDIEEEFPDVVYETIENNMKYYHELKKYCLAPAQN